MRLKLQKLSPILLLLGSVCLLFGLSESLEHGTALSPVAARYTDYFLPKQHDSFVARASAALKARCVSVLVFPVYAAVDTCYYMPKSIFEHIASWTSQDLIEAKAYSALASKDADTAGRSFVGLISFPAGLLWPDFVTRHFVPKHQARGLIEAGGQYYLASGNEVFPESIEEVQAFVREAIRSDKNITIAGAKLSQGKQILPPAGHDTVLNLANMNAVSIDVDRKGARLGAGATWRDLQAAANPFGLSVKVMQASNIFSVGGSLSVNCHGWDHQAGTLSRSVRSITIVDGNAELKTLMPDDELFGLVVGGYGLFGVIVEVELELADNVPLIDTGAAVPITDYVDYFDTEVLANPDIKMHLYRLSLDPENLLGEGIAQNYILDSSRRSPIVSKLKDEGERGKRIDRVGVHTARKSPAFRKQYWKHERKQIVRPLSTTRNEEMRAPIKGMFNNSQTDSEWLQEFFVPRDQLASFLPELGRLLMDYDVALINASVRFVKQDPHAFMGYACTQDMFGVVLCFNQILEVESVELTQEWVRRAIDMALAHEGTYYLPYVHSATPAQFTVSYPQSKQILAKKSHYDPNGIFYSQFFEDHFLTAQEEIQVALRSDDQGNLDPFQRVFGDRHLRREIRKFIRNVFLLVDEDVCMRVIDEVLTRAPSPEQCYRGIEARMGEMQSNRIWQGYRALKGLKGQKAILTQQAAELMGEDPLNGYVEIGFPARMVRPLRGTLKLSGPVTVVHTAEAISDYLQSGFPRPYDHFVPHDNYAPLTRRIDSHSVDLVTCFIGLHHCPEESLDAFVESISGVLRSGGSFLLRDHDASSDEIKALAEVAHRIFNLGTGIPWSGLGGGFDEESELRNFQGLDYWDALMARHGLERFTDRSPRLRAGDPTLNSLVRYVKVPSEVERKSAGIKQELRSVEHDRAQHQTFMTTIEWHSVAIARDHANFIEHTPFYCYPYFTHVQQLWTAFFNSWSEARRYHSRWEVMASDYFFMNAFITVFHTFEFGIKGVISAPIRYLYRSDANLEPDRIRLLVHDPDSKLELFKSKGVEILSSSSEDPSYKTVEMPRYLPFTDLLRATASQGIDVVSIAGQERIQIQIRSSLGMDEDLDEFHGVRKISCLRNPSDPSQSVLYLNVEISQLSSTLRALAIRDLEVSYIHDF